MKTNLPENIRIFRKERKMTQEQLAEIMQVSAGAVHKWEAGLSTPDVAYIMAMADLFSVSVDALIGFNPTLNFKEDAIEKMMMLQKERKLDDAQAEAEALLRKYPNDFMVLYRCAKLYQMMGVENEEENAAMHAAELFKRALNFISKNTCNDISETTLISDIAECYLVLGKADKAIDILKNNNSDGRHNVSIGMIYANLLHYPKEAEYYLTRAFSDYMQGILNIMIGYSNIYLDLGDEEMAFRTLKWLIAFIDSLREDENKVVYIDKMNSILYALTATLPCVINKSDILREMLQRAYDLAKRFDSAPIHSVDGILFCEKFDKAIATYDSLGKTAFEAVEKILYDEDQQKEVLEAVISAWEEMKNENKEK